MKSLDDYLDAQHPFPGVEKSMSTNSWVRVPSDSGAPFLVVITSLFPVSKCVKHSTLQTVNLVYFV